MIGYVPDRAPNIAEMRRVAHYLAETMQLHSAAGKLFAKAAFLERIVDGLMAYKGEEPNDQPEQEGHAHTLPERKRGTSQ